MKHKVNWIENLRKLNSKKTIGLIFLTIFFIGCSNKSNLKENLKKLDSVSMSYDNNYCQDDKVRQVPCWITDTSCMFDEYTYKAVGISTSQRTLKADAIKNAMINAREEFAKMQFSFISTNDNSSIDSSNTITKNSSNKTYNEHYDTNSRRISKSRIMGSTPKAQYCYDDTMYVLMVIKKDFEKFHKNIQDKRIAKNEILEDYKKHENDQIELVEYQDRNNNIVEINDIYFKNINGLLYEINYDLKEMQFDDAKNYCISLSKETYKCNLPTIKELSKYSFTNLDETFNKKEQYKFWSKNKDKTKVDILNLYNEKLYKNILSKYKYANTKCICKKGNS